MQHLEGTTELFRKTGMLHEENCRCNMTALYVFAAFPLVCAALMNHYIHASDLSIVFSVMGALRYIFELL